MSRHFLIALLSVLLPNGFLPSGRPALAPPSAFVTALRAMPGAGRTATRTERRAVAARPVRGVYHIPARRPSALAAPRTGTPLRDRFLEEPVGRRAPPALA